MVHANAHGKKLKPHQHITKVRAGINRGDGDGPGSWAPSGSATDWSLDHLGGGKLTDRGIVREGAGWKNR